MGDHNQYLGMQQLGKRLGKEGYLLDARGVPT